jgi:hypothetical protein
MTPRRIIIDLVIYLLQTIDRDPSVVPAFFKAYKQGRGMA